MLLFASHYWSVELAPLRLRMLVDPLRGYHATFVTHGTAVSINDAAMAQAYLDDAFQYVDEGVAAARAKISLNLIIA